MENSRKINEMGEVTKKSEVVAELIQSSNELGLEKGDGWKNE